MTNFRKLLQKFIQNVICMIQNHNIKMVYFFQSQVIRNLIMKFYIISPNRGYFGGIVLEKSNS